MMKKSLVVPILILNFYAGWAQDLFVNQDSIISKTMSERWELNAEDRNGTFKLTSYKPFYILPLRISSDVNRNPKSENLDNALSESIDLDRAEVKFQLSFKTKLIQSFLFGKGDIWVGYTQVAHWQVYNKKISRPFRELNYEPELIANYPLDFNFFGFKAKMMGMGFNHQSNGRSNPISRSWNRLTFHFAMERKNLQIYLKPWIRLDDDIDDNPEISDYIGRGEATLIYRFQKHRFYIVGTNSLKFRDNRGSIQFNYLYPIKSNLRAHLQIFNGYGESLIDYNHSQTTIGLGVSFIDW